MPATPITVTDDELAVLNAYRAVKQAKVARAAAKAAAGKAHADVAATENDYEKALNNLRRFFA